jgi:signal transduction histidine kinase
LRELAHGILPSVLTRGGLRAGVNALASRTAVAVTADVAIGRLPAAIEAPAYFVVAEALTNLAKHSGARSAQVSAWVDSEVLTVTVRATTVSRREARRPRLAGSRRSPRRSTTRCRSTVLRAAAPWSRRPSR